MKSLSWKQVHARRLMRNDLAHPAPAGRLPQVAVDTCGIQAQLLGAAELSLAIRTEDRTQADVRDALWKRRTIVKTYGLRSTLHLLSSEDVGLWMAALRTPRWQPGEWYEGHGLDETQARRFIEAVYDALDGRGLTRAELADEVHARVGDWAGARLAAPWADLLDVAAHSGVLCYGPSQGAKTTFVRLDQWIEGTQEVDPAEAVAEAVRRYLTAYGPAAHEDFARWFHMRPSFARRLFESLKDELEQVEVEGTPLWVTAGDLDEDLKAPAKGVRLLPQYDCYVIGCRQRSRFIPEPAMRRISTYGRGRFEGPVAVPLLLIDGIVTGMWRHKQSTGAVSVTVEAFRELGKKELSRLEAEVERLGAFYGLKATLALGTLV